MSDLLDRLGLIAKGVLGIALVIAILNPFFGGLASQSGGERVVGEARFGTTDTAKLRPPVDTNLAVQQSLGTKIAFGGDGSFTASVDSDVDETYAYCTWASLNAAATGHNETIAVWDGEQHLQYAGNRTHPHYVGTWYDPGARVTYDVAVNASAISVTSPTHLCLEHDGDTLTLSANATNSNSVATDGSHTVTDGGVTGFSGLDGTVEETRLYDATLSTTERAALRDHPTAPVPTPPTRVARVMYDSYHAVGSSMPDLPVYFTSSSGTVDGGSVVEGFAGQPTDGDDYNLENGGFRLVATDGGTLDGAPVAFVQYDAVASGFARVYARVQTVGATALGIIVVGLLLIAAGFVVDRVGEF